MKTLFFLLTITMLCLSCTKETIEPDIKQVKNDKVKVLIDYGFTSGNIKGPVYMDFYNKYILSKTLTPRTYQLIFTNRDSTSFRTTAVGKWGINNFISLPQGKYIVTGESNPTEYVVCGDTCYLAFDDTISITSTTTSITLKAKYDCCLILIDTLNVKSTLLTKAVTSNPSTFKNTLMKTDEYYHTFARDYFLMGRDRFPVALTLQITKRDNNMVNMLLWEYTWQNGKYYYFANTGSGYTIPAMGN